MERTNLEVYRPGRKALDAGAISTRDMTDVMAQVKLMWALAKQDPRDPLNGLQGLIQHNSVGEVTE